MPTYDLRNAETGEVEELIISHAEKVRLLDSGKYSGEVFSAPKLLGHTNGMLSKTDDSWKDILKTIKKHSGRGNTIKV